MITSEQLQKEGNPKFTPTVAINKISSPFINKTESTEESVKFDCTGVTHKSE